MEISKFLLFLVSFVSAVTFSCKENEVTPNPFIAIPDANFEKYLVEAKIDKDGTVNGKMAKADAKGVQEINCSGKSITSLVGIENFVDLTTLYCSDNQLTNLDVSKNVALERLSCIGNQLTNLDVSKNVVLRELVCWYNQLTNLDVSKNVRLVFFSCDNNPLTTICVADAARAERKPQWSKDATAEYKICN